LNRRGPGGPPTYRLPKPPDLGSGATGFPLCLLAFADNLLSNKGSIYDGGYMIIKVICWFPNNTLKMATQNIQDSNGNWQNKIINISSLSRNIGEDKSYEISGMSIEMNDNDRFFRTIMSGDNRYISGNKVEIKGEDDTLIYTGTVEKWQFKEDAFILFINDKLSGLETLVSDIISKEQYPDMADKTNGQSIPLIYGNLDINGGAVKCWRIDTDRFLLAGHHCNQLIGTNAYNEEGTPIAASLDNNTDGRAYINCVCQDDFVCVNVSGKENNGGLLIQDPIEALEDLIFNYTGMTYNQAHMENASEIMYNRGYQIACVIDKQQNLQDILKAFSTSFDCDFYIGKGNEIMISMLNWSKLAPARRFIEDQVFDFNMEELPEDIKNKVKYRYQHSFAREEFQQEPVYIREESVAGWGEFYNRNEPLDLLYVSDGDAAFDVVQRYVIQRKNPRRIANLDLPLSEFIGLDISDVIEIQHPGAIDDSTRKYQVRRTNIDFLNDTVQIEAVDITTLTGGVFLLGDRDTLEPRWELAGDNDRNFGYLADRISGYFEGNNDYGKVLY
jgi:hypothetical protein